MTLRILLFCTRKSTLTPSEFAALWESHIALIKELTGPDFPISHTRYRISRLVEGIDPTLPYPAAVLLGAQSDFLYDGLCELVFEDEAHQGRFTGALAQPDAARRLKEDEEGVVDHGQLKAVVLDGVGVTWRDG